jgi:hypothetical protein
MTFRRTGHNHLSHLKLDLNNAASMLNRELRYYRIKRGLDAGPSSARGNSKLTRILKSEKTLLELYTDEDAEQLFPQTLDDRRESLKLLKRFAEDTARRLKESRPRTKSTGLLKSLIDDDERLKRAFQEIFRKVPRRSGSNGPTLYVKFVHAFLAVSRIRRSDGTPYAFGTIVRAMSPKKLKAARQSADRNLGVNGVG